jgi:hypothetical protein
MPSLHGDRPLINSHNNESQYFLHMSTLLAIEHKTVSVMTKSTVLVERVGAL